MGVVGASGYACPCGNYFSPQKVCHCSQTKIRNYLGKISGPLLDRIDLHIEVPQVKYQELSNTQDAESSTIIRQRVENARTVQKQRLESTGILCNAQMSNKLIKKYCVLDQAAQELMQMAIGELALSARAYDKILKVSRTIADMAETEIIEAHHISEAIAYRNLDKNLWE